MYPDDVDPMSGCRLPLPRREDLGDAGQRTCDNLADPEGETIRVLRGPRRDHAAQPRTLATCPAPQSLYPIRGGTGYRVRELAILTIARELNSQFEWAAHEPEAIGEGIAQELIEIIRHRKDTKGLDEADAIVIELGREIFGARRVSSVTFARCLKQFGRRKLVDLVALMGNYASTAALLVAFDMQLDPSQPPPLPPL